MDNGFVYFIREEGTDRIKIGFTEKNPKERVKKLQTGNSNKLILLGSIDGTNQDENNLHREFSEERGNGEWFEPSPRLESRIKQLVDVSIEDQKRGIGGLSPKKKERTSPYSVETKYVGENYNGIKMGKGTLTFPNGEEYVGEFRNDLMNGLGTMTCHFGRKYVGEWKDNKMWNITIYEEGIIIGKYVNGILGVVGNL